MAEKKKYMFLIFGTGEGVQELPEEERTAHMNKWFAWTNELQDKGFYLAGDAFFPHAQTIQGKSMRVTKEFHASDKRNVIGGYYLIEASDMEHAVEIAKGCPTFELDGVIEVREIMEM